MNSKTDLAMRNTCSRNFILPILGLNLEVLKDIGLINTYLDDLNHEPHYPDHLYLLFKASDLIAFEHFFEKQIKTRKDFVEDYDYPGGYVVAVLKLPAKYKEDYEKFFDGKYSRFSDEYKAKFPMKSKIKNKLGLINEENSLFYHVFNKTDEIRDYWANRVGEELEKNAECWRIPDMKEELLDIAQLTKTNKE